MSTLRLTALIAAACVAAAVWFLLLGRGQDGPASAARRPVFAASEIPMERVTRVTLERPGSPKLVFERDATGWQQTSPYAHPGDATALRDVVDAIAALEQSRAVRLSALEPAARKALGLEPPQATLTVAWPDGERAIELGRRTVAGRAWARVRGRDEACSVDGTLHALAVEGDPRQWRSLALFDPNAGEPERLRITFGGSGDAPWVLERSRAKWRLAAPFNTRADGDAVRGYIEAISRAQADACAADQPQDFAVFGLGKPQFRVQVERVGGAVAAIEIGSPVVQGALERFGRVDGRPTVLQVGTKALAALFPPPSTFVDPRGSDVVPADVRTIAFEPAQGSSDTPFVLERVRDSWVLRVGDAQAVAARPEAVRALLGLLTETRAAAIAFNPVPPELVRGQFTLRGEGDTVLGVVRAAKEPAGRWALDNNDGVLRVFLEGFDLRLDAASYAIR